MLLAKVVGDTLEYPVDLTQFNDPNILENYANYGLVQVMATDPPELPWYKTIVGNSAQYVNGIPTQVWNTSYKDDNYIKIEFNRQHKELFDTWNNYIIGLNIADNPQVITTPNYQEVANYLEALLQNYKDYKLVYNPEFAWPQPPQV